MATRSIGCDGSKHVDKPVTVHKVDIINGKPCGSFVMGTLLESSDRDFYLVRGNHAEHSFHVSHIGNIMEDGDTGAVSIILK